MKSLDQLRSIKGPTVGPAKTTPLVNSRPSTDSVSLGAFANLKLTAEKLVKERTSVKTDLELVVTHHEYEIETSNGRTITKRRKTKSTVMFGDPNTHKRVNVKTPKSVEDVKKLSQVHRGMQTQPSNIGDLFSEGSLNPYTDDPYALD